MHLIFLGFFLPICQEVISHKVLAGSFHFALERVAYFFTDLLINAVKFHMP